MVLFVHQMEDSATHWIKDYPADKNMIKENQLFITPSTG